MDNRIITFTSMTNAMRARDLLRKHRFSARLVRTPARLRKGSCGYSLIIGGNPDRAASLLRERKIPFGGVFADDGA